MVIPYPEKYQYKSAMLLTQMAINGKLIHVFKTYKPYTKPLVRSENIITRFQKLIVRAHRKDLIESGAVIGPIPFGRPCARQTHCYISYPVLLLEFIWKIYPDLNRRKPQNYVDTD